MILLVAATAAGSGQPTALTDRRDPTPVEVLGARVVKTPPPTRSVTIAIATAEPPPTPPTADPPPSADSTPRPQPSPPTPPAWSTTCADALAYLVANQAPGFDSTCADGIALGHLGFTCVNQPGMCEGMRIIRIACPAPFVYMNEAHNSWVLTGERSGIDPYGQGNAAERAACNPHR